MFVVVDVARCLLFAVCDVLYVLVCCLSWCVVRCLLCVVYCLLLVACVV